MTEVAQNSLRAMLNEHPDIYVIPALPIYEIIFYYKDVFGDLSRDSNWVNLLNTVLSLYDANHHPLPCKIDRQSFIEGAMNLQGERNLGAAVQLVFDCLAEFSGKRYVGLKFGAYHDIVPSFLKETNFELAVFQARDPRDCAISVWKAGVDPRTPSEFALHWIVWHRNIRKYLRRFNLDYSYIRYEDLISNPNKTLKPFFNLLGVSPSVDLSDYHKREEQRVSSSVSYMWRHISEPLKRDNFNKFYAEFPVRVVRAMDKSIGDDGLHEFGYRPAKLRSFRLRSFITSKMPERRIRTKEDMSFQARQNIILEDLKNQYSILKSKTVK